MALIADGLLIATCLTTAIYCLVLSRRLRRLSDTEDGIGKQIGKLNTALDETRTALGEIRSTASGASEQLSREVAEARRQGAQLARLIVRAGERIAAAPAARGYSAERAARGGSSPSTELTQSGRRTAVSDAEEATELSDTGVGADDQDADVAYEGPVGDPQLGFLPETADLPDEPPDLRLGLYGHAPDDDDVESAALEDHAMAEPADSGGAIEPDPSSAGQRRPSERPADGNLLKVERMAL